MKNIKLNVGPSSIWNRDGWHTLDHKIREGSDTSLVGDAENIPLEEGDCSVVFSSHMFEHIPHTQLENVCLEFNRVLEEDGVLRILTPDLKKIATAYVNEDEAFFKKALSEDPNIRTDLGYGGMLVNWVVSPGQDTALFSRGLDRFIGGYAHVYMYDFKMLEAILTRCGFKDIQQKEFADSTIDELKEPLHVDHLEPVWQDLNQDFYKANDLIHYYDTKDGKYHINFKLTGFDRDPLTSLIIECRKDKTISKEEYSSMNESQMNYNRYGQSLMRDETFKLKAELFMNLSKMIDKGLES